MQLIDPETEGTAASRGWPLTKVSHKLFVLLELNDFLAFQRGIF